MDDPEQTYLWLVKDEIQYHHAIDIMVKQLHTAVQENKNSLAHAYAEELKSIGDEVGSELEKAQIRLECARAIFKLGKANEAINELNQAIALLEPHEDDTTVHKHYYAVAKWMLGSLLKRSTSKRKEAIVAWQKSLDAFQILIFRTGFYSPEKEWYNKQYIIMCEKIERIVKERTYETTKERAHQSTLIEQNNFPIATMFTNGKTFLEIVGMIPAGGFGPSGLDPYIIERLNLDPVMNEFVISGIRHKIYNLRKGDSKVTLVSSKEYFVLKVVGDSMNKTFIDPGDYVLILEQSDADNGNIVAAEVIGEDNQANLKYFTKSKRNIILQPRSSNENYKSFTFTHSEQGFFIRGVALAVFKPVN